MIVLNYFLVILLLLISAGYVVLIGWLRKVWITDQSPAVHHRSKLPFISVVLVGRNEENNIRKCLQAIAGNDYPPSHFEIIYVDDHSEDNTLIIASGLGIPQIKVMDMSGLGVTPFGRALKKAGQYHGITHSAGEIIACTDADCQVGSAWLRSIANEFNYANPDFLTGPVFVPSEGTWISRFEDLDARGTMAMTKAGISSGHIHLANGANMAFKRKAYDAYTMSTQNIRASGDDVFLVRWLAQNGYSIRFNANPSAIVMTSPKRRWIDLWQQRLRWATKTRDYLASKVVVLYVFLWIFFAGIVLSPLYLLLHPGWWWLVTIPFLSKLLADVWLFKAMERSYQLAVVRWRYVIPLSFIYCCYFLAMSVCGLFVKSYHWKGRKVS